MKEIKNLKEIESKWQKYWEEKGIYKADDNSNKKKQYNLVEFPYPSGVGMHLGHVKAYIGMEVMSRMQRMQGLNVLFPIGFDSFGLPAENYAIKMGVHPRIVTKQNENNFLRQLRECGFSFDYDRVFSTTDPEYYKWTQWIFIKLFEHGLAYRDHTYVNYCPNCKVVLSNEDSQGGKCDRCDSDVVQKEKDVWFLKITDYADKLLDGLDTIDFPSRVRLEQENWIGKSTGAYVDFTVKGTDETLKIYTTRPDTLFGVTFMVIAPEHPLIEKYRDSIPNIKAIDEYRKKANKKTEFERVQLQKDKTGIKIEGISAINPVNEEEIPIYIADYVMMGYGTGAIMAVPAHDERDYEFAIKFNIPITQVVSFVSTSEETKPKEGKKNTERQVVIVVVKHPTEGKILTVRYEKFDWKTFVMGGIENDELIADAAIREIKEETGYTDISIERINTFSFINHFYAEHKDVNRKAYNHIVIAKLNSLNQDSVSDEEREIQKADWSNINDLNDYLTFNSDRMILKTVIEGESAYTEDGEYINSGFLNGITNKKDAIAKMNEFLNEKGIGRKATQYKMKDWAFNRQRYWGEPIPIIYCDNCGTLTVPENELPLQLPEVEKFLPGENGESPLANVTEWVNCKCPKCKGAAKRETDTMPQWAGSSWYFLRYVDPHNDSELSSMDKMKKWMNVDWYNGGAEHITRHLIYARFWHKFLYDLGVVNTAEPFQKRTTIGLILGSDGSKMSKSKGNTIDPDDVIKEYGSDVLRSYVLFMGDYGDEAPWNEQGVKGIDRFLDRIVRLGDKLNNEENYTKQFEFIINKAIEKVTNDIENLKYNTAISELMKLVNEYYAKDSITKNDYRTLLMLLYPFAPHTAEELNEIYKLGVPICESFWPVVDKSKLIEEEKEIAVQVNGKLRATIVIHIDDDEETVKKKAMTDDNVKKHIEDKEIVKIIVIKSKIVNIVVK